jgi:hypothetical protein
VLPVRLLRTGRSSHALLVLAVILFSDTLRRRRQPKRTPSLFAELKLTRPPVVFEFRGATEVTDEDVYSVITLCLRHRLRKDPMATIDEGTKVLEVFSGVFGYDQE